MTATEFIIGVLLFIFILAAVNFFIEGLVYNWREKKKEQRIKNQQLAATTPTAETYAEARDRLDVVQLRYANAHFHRGQEARFIFDAPAVFDVTVPATATYLDAVAEAEAHFIGITDLDTTADAGTVDAVDAVETYWDEMVDFAQHNITTAMDHATRERVARLVNLVAHSGTDNHEAKLARDRLVKILSEITYTVPLIGGGAREIQLNPHTMFNPRQMRDMAALEHANYPQLKR